MKRVYGSLLWFVCFLITLLFATATTAGAAITIERTSAACCVLKIQGEGILTLADWGGLPARLRADVVANRLRNLLEFGDIRSVELDFSVDDPFIRTSLGILVTVDDNSAAAEGVVDKYELAKLWYARLTRALSAYATAPVTEEIYRPYERRETLRIEQADTAPVAQPKTQAKHAPRPRTASSAAQFEGTASWYGPGFNGRRTASGETYNMHNLTAAHRSLPFGTRLLVREPASGRTVVVTINDRGPFVGNRVLDLSFGAAQELGIVERGTAKIVATVLPR